MPVHAVSLVAMSLWLLDNCDLEVCAATAAELDIRLKQQAAAELRSSDALLSHWEAATAALP
jgi:capsular polysaccharide biosynthesis protein